MGLRNRSVFPLLPIYAHYYVYHDDHGHPEMPKQHQCLAGMLMRRESFSVGIWSPHWSTLGLARGCQKSHNDGLGTQKQTSTKTEIIFQSSFCRTVNHSRLQANDLFNVTVFTGVRHCSQAEELRTAPTRQGLSAISHYSTSLRRGRRWSPSTLLKEGRAHCLSRERGG